LAGPDGARLPCSHSCSVRTDTPINLANSDCDRPVLPRIFATEGTVVTRPTSPRLICRIPSRISTPMFRSFFVIAELLPDLAQDMRRDVLGLVLRIDRQHPDNALGDPDEVDHPHATSLAPSGCGPSQLPDASRPRNDVSGLGVLRQMSLKRCVLLVRQVVADEPSEERRFDERKDPGHGTSLT